MQALEKILPKFETYAEKTRRDHQVPGMAIGVIKDNQLVYSKGFGVRKVVGKNKIDENTIFQIGSISKSFTTTLLAMLVDEQKIKWN